MTFWEFAHKNPDALALAILVAALLLDAWIDTWRKK